MLEYEIYPGSILDFGADRTTIAYPTDIMTSAEMVIMDGITYVGYNATLTEIELTYAMFFVTRSQVNQDVVGAVCPQSQIGAESKISV